MRNGSSQRKEVARPRAVGDSLPSLPRRSMPNGGIVVIPSSSSGPFREFDGHVFNPATFFPLVPTAPPPLQFNAAAPSAVSLQPTPLPPPLPRAPLRLPVGAGAIGPPLPPRSCSRRVAEAPPMLGSSIGLLFPSYWEIQVSFATALVAIALFSLLERLFSACAGGEDGRPSSGEEPSLAVGEPSLRPADVREKVRWNKPMF